MASTEQTASSDKQFAIQKLYVKDLSFESPNTPTVFTEKWEPNVDINLNSNAKKAPQDLFEVSITVTVTVKNNDSVAYLVEATQVGIFGVKGFSEPELGPLLGSFCPSVLFPYLREVVSEVVTKGGFPPMLLNPVNFDALYAQHSQQNDISKAN
ncbi:MAG: preprotein translocase subunit SecB [Cycloclasticus pugetii]|jgi:preprotein translocase subunit SecB|uniref:Protein-export protein SecB n=2 Tax=Cycloclasticus TaxID=34067 RepID=S5TC45_9GAMM|nr:MULTISPECIES: protein-export chaperone SecB [Cycloclasticus]AFT66074.1 preprotein translocase subunit SecB [Cycloclasticus sp. P1]AGS38377.1 Preprotein translocase subunit SecB [Cycloclasticus zancles 78-ME]ATI02149.1 protein-export chaperone SecB [Cycloclasticus sp. PY97N]EPD13098.1 preprotein translocase subunit SecB [Cycloclasticus pugetii]MDF1829526.1 protein-export chaperone SecB [Cycloclasticus pugetii]